MSTHSIGFTVEQWMEWLRGSAPLQIQTYALIVGTLYFVAFWVIDHVGSHFFARWIPNITNSPFFQINILSLFRRVLLLCTSILLMALDYAPILRLELPSGLQQLPIEFWAIPVAMLALIVWLSLEAWILGRLLPTHRSASITDFLRLSTHSKQTLIGTDDYGRLSRRMNRMLYLVAYAHLILLIYEYRTI